MQIKRLDGLADYQATFEAMREFTANRTADTEDELWQVEHAPVYTLGQAGKPEHILNPKNIPIIRSNRGGQVTYHGPGQIVLYPLINLHRVQLFVRDYVNLLEESIIQTLADFGITNAQRKEGAPGVYVPYQAQGMPLDLAKIAALGVKVSNGCTYHGLSLNVKMDLSPFYGINPCGYAGLQTIDMFSLGIDADWQEVADQLSAKLIHLISQHQAVQP